MFSINDNFNFSVSANLRKICQKNKRKLKGKKGIKNLQSKILNISVKLTVKQNSTS